MQQSTWGRSTWASSWTATAAGRPGRGAPARRAIAPAPPWCGGSSRPRPTCGIGVLTLLRVLGRQLAAPEERGRLADAALPRVPPRRDRALRRQRRAARGHRPARPDRPRAAPGDRGRAARDRARHSAHPAHRARLFLARRHAARRAVPPARDACTAAKPSAGCSRSSITAMPVPEVDLLIRTGGEQRLERLPALGGGLRRAAVRHR